jgi:hypothetical protein
MTVDDKQHGCDDSGIKEYVSYGLSSAVWHKSTFSEANACVQVAFLQGRVAVRDSKDQQGPILVFTTGEWEAFVAGVRAGQLDHIQTGA